LQPTSRISREKALMKSKIIVWRIMSLGVLPSPAKITNNNV